MPPLSAPTVQEPLYECAKLVIVTGYVPGANVAIYVNPPGPVPPVQIGGGVSNSASGQVFGVQPAQTAAGATITATQTVGGDTSPASPAVVVQKALSVDGPVLTAPLLECARCVGVSGLLPGVGVEVRDGVTVVGTTVVAGASVRMGVNPAFASGHTITARQVYCGAPGPDSPATMVGAVGQLRLQLAPPEVVEPLFACQQGCAVHGCMPGCQVDLFVNAVLESGGCAGTGIGLSVGGSLVQGTSITARQSLCGGTVQSGLSAAVVVQPTANIPKPAIWPPPMPAIRACSWG